MVALDALPLNPNGKVDRQALPAPEQRREAAALLPPRSELESRVAEAWRSVLALTDVGVHDNFFDLGGSSLLLYRVYAQLRLLRPDLRMVDLFRYTTIATLAEHLGAQTSAPAPAIATDASRTRGAERRAARRRRSIN